MKRRKEISAGPLRFLVERNYSRAEIAKLYNVSARTISNRLREYGIYA